MIKSAFLGAAVVLLTASTASAYGALAIGGNTAEAATKGLAVGFTYDYSTQDEANDQAIKHCLAYTGAPAETVAQCKLVQGFSRAWVVIAMDPAPSTPGFGWSIDADKATAELNALNQCRASSPDERKSYCIIDGEHGDTNP